MEIISNTRNVAEFFQNQSLFPESGSFHRNWRTQRNKRPCARRRTSCNPRSSPVRLSSSHISIRRSYCEPVATRCQRLVMNQDAFEEKTVIEPRGSLSFPCAVHRTLAHELLRKIGAGGYDEVWRTRNVMGTYRAMKVVYQATFKDDRPYERELAGIKKYGPISRSHEGLVDVLHVGRNEHAGHF